jgi:hypothetical protein
MAAVALHVGWPRWPGRPALASSSAPGAARGVRSCWRSDSFMGRTRGSAAEGSAQARGSRTRRRRRQSGASLERGVACVTAVVGRRLAAARAKEKARHGVGRPVSRCSESASNCSSAKCAVQHLVRQVPAPAHRARACRMGSPRASRLAARARARIARQSSACAIQGLDQRHAGALVQPVGTKLCTPLSMIASACSTAAWRFSPCRSATSVDRSSSVYRYTSASLPPPRARCRAAQPGRP